MNLIKLIISLLVITAIGCAAPTPVDDSMALVIRYDGSGKVSETYVTKTSNISFNSGSALSTSFMGKRVFLFDNFTVIVGVGPCDESIDIRELDPARRNL